MRTTPNINCPESLNASGASGLMIDSARANTCARYVSHRFTYRFIYRASNRARRAENDTSSSFEMRPRNHVLTDETISVSAIWFLRSFLSKCAAIQIVPSGPRLARMYCE